MDAHSSDSNDRYRTLIENISHVVFTLDDQGRFTYVSPQCTAILGYPPEAMVGRTISSMVIPDDRDRLCQKYHDVKAGESYPSDYQVLDKDGAVHRVRGMSRPVRDETGKVTVVGVISELSNWQLMDDALRTSEGKVQALVEYSKDGVLLTDGSGAVIEWSPAMEQITGLPRPDAIGRPVWEIHGAFVPAGTCSAAGTERLKAEVFAALQGSAAPWLERRLVYDIVARDGRIRQVESLQFIVPAAGGNRLGAIIRDITDRRDADRALQEANRKLNLMSNISRHDIGNQLALFSGYLMLLQDPGSSSKRDEYLQHLMHSATAIQKILAFTREYQSIGVAAPVWQGLDAAIAPARSSIEPAGVAIAIDPSCDKTDIHADPMLSRVFYNLIDNSVRHGRNATEIRFSCRPDGNRLVIVYEDNGAGIPASARSRLFTKGFGKNTGYGLFLIREILAISGFSIRETGEEGRGARFEITVPPESFRKKA